MKILAITSSYPRYDGDPTAPFIESITKHIADLGHTVHVVLPESSRWARPETEGAVTYHPYRYSPRRSWTPWGFSEALERGVTIRRSLYPLAPVVAASAARTASHVLAGQRFDVVHAHWVIPNGPIAAFAARRNGLPLVVSLHGSDISLSERVGLIGRATRATFGHTDAVTAPSRDLLERAARLGARQRLEVIPYGADVHELAADPGAAAALRAELGLAAEHVIVTGIGRFVAMKGFDYLLDAMALALRARPELHLVLVGDGDLREELEHRVRVLDIGSSVTFVGMAERRAVATHLALADVVVVPSIRIDGHVDGLPNVALEAMAAGGTLVATRVGGLPQLVRDGENGILIDEKDPVALADALVRVARDPELRSRLGASARQEIIDERSWTVVAQRFVDVYEAALAPR